MAKVLAVNSSEKKGVVKIPLEKGYFEPHCGLQGDAHSGDWHRMVSLLANESIEKMKVKGLDHLKFGDFAENITTEGLIVHELPLGTILKIGEATMRVTQIGKECHAGCAIRQQSGDCIMPKEGVFAEVLEAGWVKPGDKIVVEPASE